MNNPVLRVEYKRVSSKDMPAVLNILKKVKGDRRNISPRQFIVAKHKGKIIGCGRIKEMANNCLELSSIVVIPEYRNLEIGRNLIKEILKRDKRRPVYLLCAKEKAGFYRKNGFKITRFEKLPKIFQKEYIKVSNSPFAKNIKVIAMSVQH